MTDPGNQTTNSFDDQQHKSDEMIQDNKVDKETAKGLPDNRVIRKRIAARTYAVHFSALPSELKALIDTPTNAYLTRYDLPDEIKLTDANGEKKLLSRDEAWAFADEAGAQLEWDILPDSLAGKATALFSETGQGLYANYGRPTMDFSGFYHDYVRSVGQNTTGSILLGPIFIAMDTSSAIGFTALGHLTRKARLTDKTVLSDVVSTGIYEGTSAWSSAKLGVLTGASAIRLTAALPIPGAHVAAAPVGFLVGATTAILAKHYANKYKDKALDTAQESIMQSRSSGWNRQLFQFR